MGIPLETFLADESRNVSADQCRVHHLVLHGGFLFFDQHDLHIFIPTRLRLAGAEHIS